MKAPFIHSIALFITSDKCVPRGTIGGTLDIIISIGIQSVPRGTVSGT